MWKMQLTVFWKLLFLGIKNDGQRSFERNAAVLLLSFVVIWCSFAVTT
jgi:hypothetical protein